MLPETEEVEKVNPVGPAFNADSAYAFTQAQCDFGPRSMNSVGHDRCAEWIVNRFKAYGCKVEIQRADLTGYDGTVLKSQNIMASYRPELTTRILLCAHWDSRPWADNDPDSANWHKPIMAANDAASGVAVMLEIARLLNQDKKLNIGVDFVCFDAEDWGTPQWADVEDDGESWALGAQYWAQHIPGGYAPRYGILLDMVGGQGARFFQEQMSKQYAPDIVKKVWRAARSAGYGSFFPKTDGGAVTDDHIPVNDFAKIPTIDIIPYYPDCRQSSFGPTWHTLADDMQHIDKNTLKAVGQTVIQVLFME
ncbi:M28 family peptidase [Prevotella sp. S7 MS 2]|uniref:M28 family peptidase n=1 Tax=unclassified Prevotella TaxID=2638335 RepID=UPI00350F0D34